MALKSCSLLCMALVLAVSSSIHAMDITKTLAKYPDLSTFNKYLTETKLADQINTRNTITILAVDNAGLGAISGKSQQAIKATLSTHVVLDYFDEKKLFETQGSGQLLTTLYQSSGLAVKQQGFVKVKLIGEGEIAFGSAVAGAPMAAELVKTVTSIPYNISILQVSKPIEIPGIDSQTPSSNAQSPTGAAAKAPAQATKAQAPTHSANAKAPAQSETPPPTEEATSPSPTDESVTESPVGSPTTTPAQAPGPVADEPGAADASAPSSSSSTIQIGLVGVVMILASLLIVS